ncbi:MAG: L,D-transpeptidase family protein [Gammaproteobacteria bacterium]|nr:L,D-transpeptidase family protein [Gammaproteobacteria bacterium]
MCCRASGTRARHAAFLGCLFLYGPSEGASFVLPGSGVDVVGEIGSAVVAEGETLLDIARHHDLGYNEITAANPDVDPWVPPPGTTVVLPTRFVLPAAPRRGIIINLAEMRLYYYPEPAGHEPEVLTFPIGIGQEGWGTPLGVTEVIGRIKDPSWTVPASIREEHERMGDPLPGVVPPGPDNPLGAYALRLGMGSYLIHGTNRPYGIGRRASHGCVRLYPEDIETLFERVTVPAPVWLIDQPYKLGRDGAELVLEVHAPIADQDHPPADYFSPLLSAAAAVSAADHDHLRDRVAEIVTRESGVPEPVAELAVANAAQAQGWMLQLGAFAQRGNAARLADELRAQGATVTVSANLSDGYCHVLVGPYSGREGALAALEEIRQGTGYTGSIVAADRPGALAECRP